ncbi:hypothetical protein [Marinifilum flexuosum]|uniref:Uncharacterized protein n=1 Tax=Marinifilum flexuosum TaxID=1117708 RepID=A0A419X468_9BACT|nr:hypothetical protein [Marinifilum flexuosum]RKE02409.1 hypothetical protein BXY64_2498 [Marinifilum flexuosum]
MNTSFEKRIERFLQEQPESDAAKIILKLKQQYPHHKTFYDIFDSFYSKIGGIFGTQTLFIENSNKEYYTPYIQFAKGNPVNLPEGKRLLYDPSVPFSEEECYSKLAKKIVYTLLTVKDIEQYI